MYRPYGPIGGGGRGEGTHLTPAPDIDREEGQPGEQEDYSDLLKRVQADFVNYKRRVEQEREEHERAANRDLILRLLPIVDDIGNALDSVPEGLADSQWVQGMALIRRKLHAVLEAEGLRPIAAQGQPFDPRLHEAVWCQGGADGDDGMVRAVLREGYRLHDRVLRPAQVVVSSARGTCD